MKDSRDVITERQEFVLSYLVGLGPVGTEVCCTNRQIEDDLGMSHWNFLKFMRKLIWKGAVKVSQPGRACNPTWYVVLRRPEEFTPVEASTLRDTSGLIHTYWKDKRRDAELEREG